MALTPTTWNPSDKGSSVTLSNGNLTASSNATGSVRSVFGASTGKYYFEVSSTTDYCLYGIGRSTANISNMPAYPGANNESWGYYELNGNKYHGNVESIYAPNVSNNAVGLYIDLDSGTIGCIINGIDRGVMFSGIPAGTYYAMAGGGSSGAPATMTANFGGSAFLWAPPIGYNAGFGAGENVVVAQTVASNIETFAVTVGTDIRTLNLTTSAITTNVAQLLAAQSSTVTSSSIITIPKTLIFAASDETTDIVVGDDRVTIRIPDAGSMSRLVVSLTTPQSSGTDLSINIKKNGTSILGSDLIIPNASFSASQNITPITFVEGDKVTVDVISAGIGAKGLKITLYITGQATITL